MFWTFPTCPFVTSATVITLAGDVTGPSNANTVGKLQGRAVSSSAPTTGDVLEWNGSAWIPATLPTGAPQLYTCPSGATVGQPVYETGADFTVALADATTGATGPAIGLVASKPSSTTCYLMQVGILVVPYALPADGSELYLATSAGGVTATAPTSSGNIVQGLAEVVSQTGKVIQVHVDPSNFITRA